MASADDLLNMFATMGTTDHATLVEQFVQVAGCERDTAVFFLEANNWTLQSAIASYFDSGAAALQFSQRHLQAEFVCDVTIGEGEEIPPRMPFQKVWRLRNNGMEAWPQGTCLAFLQGEQMRAPRVVPVPSLPPGAVTDVSVNMVAPTECGNYAGSWRLCTTTSGVPQYFGDQIWVVIVVAEGGTQAITQGLHAASFGPSHQSVLQSGSVADDSMPSNIQSTLHPHMLVHVPEGMSIRAWACDARYHPRGCHRGPEQMQGIPRFTCSCGCNFNLCVDCIHISDPVAASQFGAAMPITLTPSPFASGGFGSLADHSFGASVSQYAAQGGSPFGGGAAGFQPGQQPGAGGFPGQFSNGQQQDPDAMAQ